MDQMSTHDLISNNFSKLQHIEMIHLNHLKTFSIIGHEWEFRIKPEFQILGQTFTESKPKIWNSGILIS